MRRATLVVGVLLALCLPAGSGAVGSQMFHTMWGQNQVTPGEFVDLEGGGGVEGWTGWFPPILNCGNRVDFSLIDSQGRTHSLGYTGTDEQWPSYFNSAQLIPPDVPGGTAKLRATQRWRFRLPFVGTCVELARNSSSFSISVTGETGVTPPHINALSIIPDPRQGRPAAITVKTDVASRLTIDLKENFGTDPRVSIGQIVDQSIAAGTSTVSWTVPTSLPPGVYSLFAQLHTSSYASVVKRINFAIGFGP
ncbi:MAG: hypothetical protein QOG93_1934 [Gaiellaceae bacterium]|jgi:hypothetical protein|nr:hypothetical protein [Gaiellaceae bacterium]MDX6388678.1 hypothetical protein [Gaiellaceae bacterium]